MSQVKSTNTQQPKKKLVSNKALFSIIAVVAGLLVGLLISAIAGFDIVEIAQQWWNANFATKRDIGTLLGNFAWLSVLGLSLVVSFRAGIFNIGSVGQLVAGGMSAFLVGSYLEVGRFGVVITTMSAVFAGMVVALLIGFLKNKFRIHEVVSSIMINWILFYLYKFVDPGSLTLLADNSLQAVWLSDFFDGAEAISTGIFFVLLIPVFWMLYKFTTFGYKQDIVGSNASALDYVGINRKREQYKTFMISGALAGLAGAMVFIGQTNPPFNEFQADMPAAFYNGISISLLAANAPLGIIFSTFMIASFETAAAEIGTVTGGVPVAEIILAVSLIFVASFRVFDYINPFEKIKVWWNSDDDEEEDEKIKDKKVNKGVDN